MLRGVLPVVLVVDDDRVQVALVTAVLRKAGFRVLGASSPIDALAALKVAGEAIQGISVLVTDLEMPGMSGVAFAAEMVTRHPGLKVLYLTASADALFQDTHVLQPHEAFLEKPVSAHSLREAVNLLL
jgi:CheY-like chemotaxis protein